MKSGIIRRSLLAAGIGLAAAALTACASGGGTAGSGEDAPVTSADLVGSWVTGESYPTAPTEPYLALADDGTWKGSDGCNNTVGDWSLTDDGVLSATSGFSTLIGCQGADLPGFLKKSSSAYLSGDSLILADDAGDVLVTLVPAREGTVE
ncbi:META domain-containing protein [Herbiconiux liukaitaii]|uniref:META domain-containing protein n=1 Tax=Herbiconiux liukaitaii TaxID=3342799 RepID=UPI0035B71612